MSWKGEVIVMSRQIKVVGTLVLGFLFTVPAMAGQLLINGDFEAAPILGPGQSPLNIGHSKWTTTGPTGPLYSLAISGISGWNYTTPESNGTHTDVGLARLGNSLGAPDSNQGLFSNRWGKLVSQTVNTSFHAGTKLTATVDFATLGSPTDSGRAGYFYLVAGGLNPTNPEQFAADSILLGSLSVANPQWSRFTADVLTPVGQYRTLQLQYTFQENDPALLQPITVGMRLANSSVGAAYWDNASLTAVPEPGTLGLAVSGLASTGGAMAFWSTRRRKRTVSAGNKAPSVV